MKMYFGGSEAGADMGLKGLAVADIPKDMPNDLLRADPGLDDWSIMRCWRGSIAHGLYLPPEDDFGTDDWDIYSVCVPPQDYFMGLKTYASKGRGTRDLKVGPWDVSIHEIRKFFRLLIKGNPNVLMILWMPDCMFMKLTPAWVMIRQERDRFMGAHVYKSFIGYAEGQLNKMKRGHRNGYMGAKRKRLVDRFGYDTKNASHLIRLMTMGIEFLKTGRMQVDRAACGDRDMLLDIKRGGWTMDQIEQEAGRLRAEAEEVYLKVRSSLPAGPDSDFISDLCVAVVKRAMADRGQS